MDEVIARDIHRTFPEYGLFAFEQGQQALFRVLKAYSLHDLEVGGQVGVCVCVVVGGGGGRWAGGSAIEWKWV